MSSEFVDFDNYTENSTDLKDYKNADDLKDDKLDFLNIIEKNIKDASNLNYDDLYSNNEIDRINTKKKLMIGFMCVNVLYLLKNL
jgi:hypothetical protein